MTSSKKVYISDPHTPLPLYPSTFKNDNNIVTYSFFISNAHGIYYSHVYNKTDRKAKSFSPSRLLWKANVHLVFPL